LDKVIPSFVDWLLSDFSMEKRVIHPQEITKQYHTTGQVKEKIDVEKVKTNNFTFIPFFKSFMNRLR